MDHIKTVNLVPKFLTFYEKAKNVSDKERIFELWKEHYNFAALPPVADYDSRAKALLDNAWGDYGQVIDYLEAWKPSLENVYTVLDKVKTILGFNEPINLTLIYFVGAFEDNAFVAPLSEEETGLFLPVEGLEPAITLAHELTHIVHLKKAQLKAEWERSIASIIMTEGLAMQVSKEVVPAHPISDYTDFTKDWFTKCLKHKKAILEGIMPYLEATSSDVVKMFTIGQGTTNHEREAYFVGWVCIEELRTHGYSIETLAKFNTEQYKELIKESMQRIIQAI